jgi:hypothetical protein
MKRRLIACALAGICGASNPLGAQDPRIADSLFRSGSFDRAESEYYAAARARPRDPNARWALGRYLVARGATRIGMTLIEEAVQFGFDRRSAAMALAPLYMDLGEYPALDKLAMSPLSPSQKTVVRWLAEHPSRVIAPDSTVLVAFARSTNSTYLGTALIRLNGVPVRASIAARNGCGIRIAETSVIATKVRRYPPDHAGATTVTPAIADSIGLGKMTLTSVPLEITSSSDVPAVICLGILARYAPTFDPRALLITLRLSGNVPAPTARAETIPLVAIDGNYLLAARTPWSPLEALKDRRWTFDAKHGQVVVDP